MSIFNRNKKTKNSMEIIEIYFKNDEVQTFSSLSNGLSFSDEAINLQKWWERKIDVHLFVYSSGMLLLRKNEISFINIYVEEE